MRPQQLLTCGQKNYKVGSGNVSFQRFFIGYHSQATKVSPA